MRRKTVLLREMIEQVNRRNRLPTCDSQIRQGWNDLLETFLHLNNVYAGFGYYTKDHLGENITPGVDWPEWDGVSIERGKAIFPDETRRFFYLHKHLQ